MFFFYLDFSLRKNELERNREMTFLAPIHLHLYIKPATQPVSQSVRRKQFLVWKKNDEYISWALMNTFPSAYRFIEAAWYINLQHKLFDAFVVLVAVGVAVLHYENRIYSMWTFAVMCVCVCCERITSFSFLIIHRFL